MKPCQFFKWPVLIIYVDWHLLADDFESGNTDTYRIVKLVFQAM